MKNPGISEVSGNLFSKESKFIRFAIQVCKQGAEFRYVSEFPTIILKGFSEFVEKS